MASFRALGLHYEVALYSLKGLRQAATTAAVPGRARTLRAMARARAIEAPAAVARLVSASTVLKSRVDDPLDLALVQAAGPRARRALPAAGPARPDFTLVTQTVIVEGLRQADLAAARNFGAAIVDEGLDGKVLMKVDSVDRVFGLVDLLIKREVGAVSPNFLRRVVRPQASAPTQAWAHTKIGVPAAWAITKGNKAIKVAVLDEGVDTRHPALGAALVAERDFIGGHDHARPDGNDSHGTMCAGVVVSRSRQYPGVAPKCSLIAVRIAMGDGADGWVFDDYATADAIDWAWRQGAEVLSNSWGGGAPSDAISRALARARTQGRNGKGAVVCIAAGNDQRPIDFPGSLPGYVTVGASNPKDERKTRASSDGEDWWGSNYGDTLRLLAPGVFIWTTDITGASGDEPGNFTKAFNGTSAATPHAAGAAALMLSVNPDLGASTIRNMLGKTARRLPGQTGWTRELGWGRLDIGKAVAMARDARGPVRPKRKARKR